MTAQTPSSVFRHRDFALLWSGLTVSSVGDAVTFVALPLVAVLVLHASAFQVGLISAASSAAWLLVALPAGAWVDRTRKRRIMIGSDIARAVLMATIPVAWWLGDLTVAQLVVVALLVGVGGVLFTTADSAFLPQMLPRERLADGNGALQASMAASNIVGPGFAGFLIQLVGAPVALLVDAVSFLVSAVTVMALRTQDKLAPAPDARPRLLVEMANGLRYVLRTPLTRTVAIGIGLCNLVLGGYDTVVILFLARQLHEPAGVIGVLFGVGSIGGVIATMAAGRITRRLGDARTILVTTIIMPVTGLLLPLTTRGWGLAWFVVASTIMLAAIGVFNVCVISAIQTHTPDHLLGRITASTRLFTRGAIPLGALAGGALASWLPPRGALALIMVLLLHMPLVFRLSPLGRVRTVAEIVTTPPVSAEPATPAVTTEASA